MKQTSTEHNQARDEIRQAIIDRSKEYFKADKSGKGYICPICGSGNGEHGTGITENPKKPNHFTCWRGCYESADIFEIIGKQFGLYSFADQFNKACDIFGISLDDEEETPQPRPRTSSPKPTTGTQDRQKELHNTETLPAGIQDGQKEDFTAFCREASRHIEETEYHRGISLETLKHYGVGFVPAWRHPNAPASVPTSPRLIIPVSRSGYIARDTRKDLSDNQKQYAKQRAGHAGLYNVKALKQSTAPVWITEGELDALSIIDAGGEAIALCSTTNAGKLIEAVKAEVPKMPLIVALDNDEAGERASTQIAEALKQLNFSFYRKEIPDPYKDENEFLMADPEKFREWVRAGTAEALQCVADDETREREAFERESVANHLPEFMKLVRVNRDRPAISTGFSNLDNLLDGGLYAGLYFVGAISSLGKTTLALQIADSVAKAGYGVLIFSLEMARSELMAKALSRMTFSGSVAKYGNTSSAMTTRGILRGRFTEKQQELVLGAIREYSEWGQREHITVGVGDVGVSHIRAKTEEYIKHIGKPPVIVIDYLQILQNPECKHSLTDKQAVDKNVMELKRISRDYDTPVIGISSFNRDNYSAPVNMASFKESGAVEYSSDVLIGLQYYGWDFQDSEKGEKDAQRMMRIRAIREANENIARELGAQDIQLKVLKNRNGKKGNCRFDFWPAFNYFRAKEGE